MRRLMVPALLLALTLPCALPGCVTGTASDAPLIVSASSPVADVPIPAGFYMTSESRSSLTPGTNLRFVDHFYKGTDGFMPVVNFYRQQLPEKGWTINTQQQSGDNVVLTCTKASETLVLTIWEGTRHTHVHANIVPSARNAAK